MNDDTTEAWLMVVAIIIGITGIQAAITDAMVVWTLIVSSSGVISIMGCDDEQYRR